jgi:hypothetical protein
MYTHLSHICPRFSDLKREHLNYVVISCGSGYLLMSINLSQKDRNIHILKRERERERERDRIFFVVEKNRNIILKRSRKNHCMNDWHGMS